jgi:hypothetical protein
VTDRGERRRLMVTGSRQVASGHGERGEWRLHELSATTVDGKPIRARLVSFEAFEPGEVDVLVERQDHPEHGVSYLLRWPRPALAGRLDALEHQLRSLTDRVKRLEERG